MRCARQFHRATEARVRRPEALPHLAAPVRCFYHPFPNSLFTFNFARSSSPPPPSSTPPTLPCLFVFCFHIASSSSPLYHIRLLIDVRVRSHLFSLHPAFVTNAPCQSALHPARRRLPNAFHPVHVHITVPFSRLHASHVHSSLFFSMSALPFPPHLTR